MCLSKKKRNDYKCTTQHIITTKLLSSEKQWESLYTMLESCQVMSVGQSRIWLYAFSTGECLSLSVRMRDARTLDLTILHSVHYSLTIEIEHIPPTISYILDL